MNNIIPAVEKSVQLMQSLVEKPSTQAELSKRFGIAMSTTYRILMTLQAAHWVRKGADGVYAPAEGLLALTLGVSEDMAVLEKARHMVVRLSEEHHVACKVSIRRGSEQLTCFRAEPPGPVALTGQSGSTFPLIEGSVGAALLSGESDARIRDLISSCPAEIPEKQHPELLWDGIAEVRQRGTVLNLRKNRWNIAAFSIPLHDSMGHVAAVLTLIGASEDFAGTKRAFWEKILKSAAAACEPVSD